MTRPRRAVAGPVRLYKTAAEQSAPGTVIWHVERAVLGAILCRPERSDEVGAWLRSRDFADPVHATVYSRICDLRAAGALRPIPEEFINMDPELHAVLSRNVVEVSRALASGPIAAVASNAQQLVTDLYVAGRDVDVAALPHYGEQIVAMSARRQVEVWGIRIEQAVGAEVGYLRDLVGTMVEDLADLEVQIQRAAGDVYYGQERSPVAPPPQPAATVPAPPATLASRAEHRLIHAVLSDRQQRGLLDRFPPEAFVTSLAHTNTWRVMQHLHNSGKPVDPLSVALECEAVLALAGQADHGSPEMLELTELMTLASPLDADVDRAADIVTRSAQAARSRSAATDMQATAADRSRPAREVVRQAKTAGGGLADLARRLAGQATPASTGLSIRLDGAQPPRTR
jgi:hypothetical protein